MRQSERNKRNLIVIGLCAVVAIMAVGFAVFSQQLQINSTSEVTSTWDVHIKNNGVSYKDAVAATSTLAEKTSALVATFACSLTTPGTSTISYDIIVENKGSLNAKLDSINLTGGNSAISVVTSPTNASLATSPIVLGPDDETTITVIVSYNNVQTQPTGDGAISNITATFNFSQTNDAPVQPSQATYVYRWSTSSTWNANQDISGMTEGTDYVTTASAVTNMNARGANYYLKYKIENNIATESYVCFVGDKEYCLRGGKQASENPSAFYESNVNNVLSEAETWFISSPQNGSCSLDSSGSYSYCYGGPFYQVNVYSDGLVYVGDTVSANCYVNFDGSSYCYV